MSTPIVATVCGARNTDKPAKRMPGGPQEIVASEISIGDLVCSTCSVKEK